MTRFARSKGSKASNERVPEEATPWQEMKKQMNQELHDSKKEFDTKKAKAYLDFIKEEAVKKSQSPTWAEFEDRKAVKPKETIKRKTLSDEESLQKSKKDRNTKPSIQLKCKTTNVAKKSRKKLKVADRGLTNAVPEDKQKEMDVEKSEIGKESISPEAVKKIQKKKEKRLRQIEKKKQHPDKTSQQNLADNKNAQKPLQTKQPKKLKDPRNKPPSRPNTQITLDGNVIDIAYFQGFPIRKEDEVRLKQLEKDMASKGIPRSEIVAALKMERRRAEKALAREKKKVCFNCRGSGHLISECPNLDQNQAATGICFKCGSTEHTYFECKVVREQEFKFAQCFICNEQVKQ